MTISRFRLSIILLVVTLFAIPKAARAQSETAALVVSTPHFAFYSDSSTNLHNALVNAGRARRARQPEILLTGPDKTCFDALSAAERAGWMRAVDYYAEVLSPLRWFDGPAAMVRLELAGVVRRDAMRDADQRFVDIAEGIRDAAAPAYRQCRWRTEDSNNRRWINRAAPLLAVHERALGQRLPELYRTPWAGLPFRTDVVETVDALGANAMDFLPPGLHILVPSSYAAGQDRAALELLFHEASHFLTRFNTPLPQALAAATQGRESAVPGDLTHGVHFFMTGEAVRRILADAGEPPYVPFLDALGLSSDGFRVAVKRVWPAYMDGRRTMIDAANDLVGALSQQAVR